MRAHTTPHAHQPGDPADGTATRSCTRRTAAAAATCPAHVQPATQQIGSGRTGAGRALHCTTAAGGLEANRGSRSQQQQHRWHEGRGDPGRQIPWAPVSPGRGCRPHRRERGGERQQHRQLVETKRLQRSREEATTAQPPAEALETTRPTCHHLQRQQRKLMRQQAARRMPDGQPHHRGALMKERPRRAGPTLQARWLMKAKSSRDAPKAAAEAR